MQYSKLVEIFEKIEATTKRLEITSLLVQLLKETPASAIDKVVYLTQGKLYADYLGVELGIAEKLLIRAVSLATGENEAHVSSTYKRTGDVGTTVEKLLTEKGKPLLMKEDVSVEEVYGVFDKIAGEAGSGSTEAKIRLLTNLINRARPVEAKYLARMAVGKLRLGVADMTILDALAIALGGGKESRVKLERAYNLSSDLGYVASTLATGGMGAIETFHVTVGKPIRPMLAERLGDSNEILAKMGGEAAAEYKYDGLRIQAHLSNGNVSLYSRRLENITPQFPDVQKLVSEGLSVKEAIVEGEAVPIDPSTGDLLPFQLVSQRRGRKYELEKMVEEIPIGVFLFDLLYADGTDYTRVAYPQRRRTLGHIVRIGERLRLSNQIIVKESEQLDSYIEQAVTDGCEGLMVKSLGPDSFYKAGARGWNWIKYKRDYKSEMQDTVDLVVVGAFSGRGRRGGNYGALLLAAYDDVDDVFRTVCKCGSGFKDEDLANLPAMLERYLAPHRHARVDSRLEADVWFVPGLVLEVTGSEITLSPIHTCGMNIVRTGAGLAIRFPRFTGRYRDDKSPEQSTTTKEIIGMYRSQLKKLRENPTPEIT
jgi:DNA ligase 1